MSDAQQHASNLNAARSMGNLKNTTQNVQKNVKAAMNIGSLMTYIDPFMDWLFGIALIFAIIKDVLDLVGTALDVAGGVGEVLIIIFTTICSLAIGFIMFLTGSSGKTKVAKTIAKKIMLLIVATLVEYIPGVDVLPIESIVVVVIVWMTLTERKTAAEASRENSQGQTEVAAA